jgi:hypothetical protein
MPHKNMTSITTFHETKSVHWGYANFQVACNI